MSLTKVFVSLTQLLFVLWSVASGQKCPAGSANCAAEFGNGDSVLQMRADSSKPGTPGSCFGDLAEDTYCAGGGNSKSCIDATADNPGSDLLAWCKASCERQDGNRPGSCCELSTSGKQVHCETCYSMDDDAGKIRGHPDSSIPAGDTGPTYPGMKHYAVRNSCPPTPPPTQVPTVSPPPSKAVVGCPAHTTGADVTSGCKPDAGYVGTIRASSVAPGYTGSVAEAKCPDHTSGDGVVSGCTPDRGYRGSVTACVCAGGFTSTVDEAECPDHTSGNGVLSGCTPDTGYSGSVTPCVCAGGFTSTIKEAPVCAVGGAVEAYWAYYDNSFDAVIGTMNPDHTITVTDAGGWAGQARNTRTVPATKVRRTDAWCNVAKCKVGDKIEGKYGGGSLYDGTITGIASDGTIDLKFKEDSSTQAKTPAQDVRLPDVWCEKTKPTPAPTPCPPWKGSWACLTGTTSGNGLLKCEDGKECSGFNCCADKCMKRVQCPPDIPVMRDTGNLCGRDNDYCCTEDENPPDSSNGYGNVGGVAKCVCEPCKADGDVAPCKAPHTHLAKKPWACLVGTTSGDGYIKCENGEECYGFSCCAERCMKRIQCPPDVPVMRDTDNLCGNDNDYCCTEDGNPPDDSNGYGNVGGVAKCGATMPTASSPKKQAAASSAIKSSGVSGGCTVGGAVAAYWAYYEKSYDAVIGSINSDHTITVTDASDWADQDLKTRTVPAAGVRRTDLWCNAATCKVGDKIEGKYDGGSLYDGTITGISSDGAIDLKFKEDSSTQAKTPAKEVRLADVWCEEGKRTR